jgi:hypothetical protein
MTNKRDSIINYAAAVADTIASIFKNEEDINITHYDLDTINATEFFTGAITGLGILYNQLTGDDKNSLQFTHLANQLIVQDLLRKAKGE